jgi:hypothetical protein
VKRCQSEANAELIKTRIHSNKGSVTMIFSSLSKTPQYDFIRGFAAHAFQQHQHSPRLVGGAAAALGAAGSILTFIVIGFAPSHEFDDLDCQSFCQRGMNSPRDDLS